MNFDNFLYITVHYQKQRDCMCIVQFWYDIVVIPSCFLFILVSVCLCLYTCIDYSLSQGLLWNDRPICALHYYVIVASSELEPRFNNVWSMYVGKRTVHILVCTYQNLVCLDHMSLRERDKTYWIKNAIPDSSSIGVKTRYPFHEFALLLRLVPF